PLPITGDGGEPLPPQTAQARLAVSDVILRRGLREASIQGRYGGVRHVPCDLLQRHIFLMKLLEEVILICGIRVNQLAHHNITQPSMILSENEGSGIFKPYKVAHLDGLT